MGVRSGSSAQIWVGEGLMVVKTDAKDGEQVGKWWELTVAVCLVLVLIAGAMMRIVAVVGGFFGYWRLPR